MMNEREYAELIQHFLNSLEVSGAGRWQGQVYEASLGRGSGREQLLGALRSFRELVISSGDRVPDEILRRINNIASTPSGERINGLFVDLGDDEVRAFGTERLDLATPSADQQVVVAQIDELLTAIEADR